MNVAEPEKCAACDEPCDWLNEERLCQECEEHFDNEDEMRAEEERQSLEAEDCELDDEDRIDEDDETLDIEES